MSDAWYEAVRPQIVRDHGRLADYVDLLRLRVGALRGALESVEHTVRADDPGVMGRCPSCGRSKISMRGEHADNCELMLALALVRLTSRD